MNSGGAIAGDGKLSADPSLEYSEKGDWSDAKNAIARRKALAENASKYNSSDQIDSPTVSIYPAKKG